jgi:hypothetical protein
MIAPNRRRRGKTQDDRPLWRHRRHWKAERLFAWMHNFLGFTQRVCLPMLMKRL